MMVMRGRTTLQLTWLLLCVVHCHGGAQKLSIASTSAGMKLTCPGGQNVTKPPDGSSGNGSVLLLPYDDDLSGEYGCGGDDGEKIYVMFHSCDLCVDLNPKALISISVADLVATALIGWAVYLIMSRGHAPKGSDKKRPVKNNSRTPNDADDTYQALRPHQPDVYDVLQSGNRS